MKLDTGAGELRVTGDLDDAAEEEFKRACLDLVARAGETRRQILIDLAEVKFVSTACLGVLFLVYDNASSLDIGVRVRVNGKIAGICKMMGLDKLVGLDVTD